MPNAASRRTVASIRIGSTWRSSVAQLPVGRAAGAAGRPGPGGGARRRRPARRARARPRWRRWRRWRRRRRTGRCAGWASWAGRRCGQFPFRHPAHRWRCLSISQAVDVPRLSPGPGDDGRSPAFLRWVAWLPCARHPPTRPPAWSARPGSRGPAGHAARTGHGLDRRGQWPHVSCTPTRVGTCRPGTIGGLVHLGHPAAQRLGAHRQRGPAAGAARRRRSTTTPPQFMLTNPVLPDLPPDTLGVTPAPLRRRRLPRAGGADVLPRPSRSGW